MQEALQNTLKYGQATHLLVEMQLNGEQDSVVSISDDGMGTQVFVSLPLIA